MSTKNIRWLLTESKISSLNTNEINFQNNKLICYHLTSVNSWLTYNRAAASYLNNDMFGREARLDRSNKYDNPEREERVTRILNRLKVPSARTTQAEFEEFVINDLIGDPYTTTSGFKPGGGDWHGKGLYTCYKFNPNIARIYGNICFAFEIDVSNFLITAEDLAKSVHGEEWRLKDQIKKMLLINNNNDYQSLTNIFNFIDRLDDNELKMSKSVNSESRTAGIPQYLISIFGKEKLPSLFDGVILWGLNDGPVCVSYYPKYDARLIGLGRLHDNGNVDWYDSLNDFVGGGAKNKLSFEEMNQIAIENENRSETESFKSSERPILNDDILSFELRLKSEFRKLSDFNISPEEKQNSLSYVKKLFDENQDDSSFIQAFTGAFEQHCRNKIFVEQFKVLLPDYFDKLSDMGLNVVYDFIVQIVIYNKLKVTFTDKTLTHFLKCYEDAVDVRKLEHMVVFLERYKEYATLTKELEYFLNNIHKDTEYDVEETLEKIISAGPNPKKGFLKKELEKIIPTPGRNSAGNANKFNLISKESKKNVLEVLSTVQGVGSFVYLTNQFISAMINEDIELSEHHQDLLFSQIAKSRFSFWESVSYYKYLTPKIFEKFIIPHIKKGGQGSGMVTRQLHTNQTFYELMKKDESIIDMFVSSASTNLMRVVMQKITDLIEGKNVMILSGYHYNGDVSDLSVVIDKNDIAWFEMFLGKVQNYPKINMLKSAIKNYNNALNSKRPANVIESRRIKLKSNTLKEVFRHIWQN